MKLIIKKYNLKDLFPVGVHNLREVSVERLIDKIGTREMFKADIVLLLNGRRFKVMKCRAGLEGIMRPIDKLEEFLDKVYPKEIRLEKFYDEYY